MGSEGQPWSEGFFQLPRDHLLPVGQCAVDIHTRYEAVVAREMVNVHPANGTLTCLLSGHFLRALSCLLHSSHKVQNYISTMTNILVWPPHCSAALGCPGPVSAEPAWPRLPLAGPVLRPPALCSLYTSLPNSYYKLQTYPPNLRAMVLRTVLAALGHPLTTSITTASGWITPNSPRSAFCYFVF